MSQSPTGQVTAKNCSRCGTAFGCGMSAPAGCWCANLPLTGPFESPDLDCMCPACLTEAIAERMATEDQAGETQVAQATAPVQLIENEDYYLEGAAMVFTAQFLLRRGYCCESGCRHCPY